MTVYTRPHHWHAHYCDITIILLAMFRLVVKFIAGFYIGGCYNYDNTIKFIYYSTNEKH